MREVAPVRARRLAADHHGVVALVGAPRASASASSRRGRSGTTIWWSCSTGSPTRRTSAPRRARPRRPARRCSSPAPGGRPTSRRPRSGPRPARSCTSARAGREHRPRARAPQGRGLHGGRTRRARRAAPCSRSSLPGGPGRRGARFRGRGARPAHPRGVRRARAAPDAWPGRLAQRRRRRSPPRCTRSCCLAGSGTREEPALGDGASAGWRFTAARLARTPA